MRRKYVKKNLNKKYSEADLQLAIETVNKGSSIRAASIIHHVPYTTLNSHVNADDALGKVGRPTKFTIEEEGYFEQAALALQVKVFSDYLRVLQFLFLRNGVYHCQLMNS